MTGRNGHCPHCRQSFNNVEMRDIDNCFQCFQCSWIDYDDPKFKLSYAAPSRPIVSRMAGVNNSMRVEDLGYDAAFSRPGGARKASPVQREGRHHKVKRRSGF